MCNENQLTLPFAEVVEEFSESGVPLRFPAGLPNVGPAPSIRIGDRAAVIVEAGEGAEARILPRSWVGPGGRRGFNFRSDGRDFTPSQRCVIPADGFFEFTQAELGQRRKTKWRFLVADGPSFWIAGLVKNGAFAMLTTEPGPDIAPYHDRQIVVLPKGEARDWPAAAVGRSTETIFRPAPKECLSVKYARSRPGIRGNVGRGVCTSLAPVSCHTKWYIRCLG